VQITWCDSCFKSNLGMLNPIEYEEDGKLYLEGVCSRCGSQVVSEIIDKDSGGRDCDIVWPIRHPERPPLTRIPERPAVTGPWRFSSREGYYPLRSPNKSSKRSAIVLCIMLTILILTIVVIKIYPLYRQGGF
jgi:hypothetical protein